MSKTVLISYNTMEVLPRLGEETRLAERKEVRVHLFAGDMTLIYRIT